MSEQIPICHVVALPYPGRGHVNPMLNLCRHILRARPDFLISFILTEEWLGLLPPSPPLSPKNLIFHTVPNVIPSEIGRGKDFAGFFNAVQTKMEAPVDRLLDRLPPPKPSVIVYDTYLIWVVAMGHRRNIQVASLYTMSATVFSTFHHFDLVLKNGHFRPSEAQAKEQTVDYIPGIPAIRAGDLPTPFHSKGQEVLSSALEAIKLVPKAQYLLFTSIYELESQVIDSLKQSLPIKVYSLGFSIPHWDVIHGNDKEKPEYMKWLDAQPLDSVLYISQGSFLSVSDAQLTEIVAGVIASGIRFLWVGRGEGWKMDSNNGIVVPWCDQLKVLCHPSVGGFWSHCGWNSTKEGAFAGLPMLTFPIFWDQVTNSKMIVEDWRIGERVRKDDESLVRREEVAKAVVGAMSSERIRRRAKQVRDICRNATAKGGSSDLDFLAFVQDISQA